MRPFAEGYSYGISTTSEDSWNQLVQGFDDGTIFQTWAYAATVEGRRNIAPLWLKKDGEVVAIALVRFRRLPILGVGLAYVHRGPMWRKAGTNVNVEHFRQVLRALRNEFVCKQGLTLRLNPALFDDDPLGLAAIIAQEDFMPVKHTAHERTILMDVTPPLAELRNGLSSHWKRGLKVGEKNNLEITEGTGDELFGSFIGIYDEKLERKKFSSDADVHQFRLIQSQLPEALRMRVLLGKSDGVLYAGIIYTRIGNSAYFLLGATSNSGMKSKGSYLLQWKVIESLKDQGATIYNLYGIDPVKNPGTYRFKAELAGCHGSDVHFLGKFDASGGLLSTSLVHFRDTLKTWKRRLL
jgi:lipid II:glycine glycyltransferase (peptidoglycan interpeptide bridge formation enzyme)